MIALLSRYLLVCALLAIASEEQMPFNKVANQTEAYYVQSFSINCDPHLDSSCESLPLEQTVTTLDSNNVHITINIAQLQLKSSVTYFQLESLSVVIQT